MKKIIIILLFVITVLQAQIKPNEWEPIIYASPGQTLIIVWVNELSQVDRATAMAVFESKSQYKIIAPWIVGAIYLEKANVTSISGYIIK